MPSEMKRLRQLEEENGKLKRIVADLSLDKAMLQDVLSKTLRPDRKRELVDRVCGDWKVSIRRACSTLRIDRALYGYKSKRGDQSRSQTPDQGDLRDAGEIRLSPGPCPTAA